MLSTNSTGAVEGTQTYLPFGYQRSATGSIKTDRQFTGQITDDSWLYFYNARFYDVTLGRFLSADPVVPGAGNPQALNRYSYVLNNPLRYTDPTGHSEEGAALFGCDPCEWVWDGQQWDFGQTGTHGDSPTYAILGDSGLGIPSAAAVAAGIGDPDLPPTGAQTSAAPVQGAAPVQAGAVSLPRNALPAPLPSSGTFHEREPERGLEIFAAVLSTFDAIAVATAGLAVAQALTPGYAIVCSGGPVACGVGGTFIAAHQIAVVGAGIYTSVQMFRNEVIPAWRRISR